MRKMILKEVARFRQEVRAPQQQVNMAAVQGQQQQQMPIPKDVQQWSQQPEDPRPQETMMGGVQQGHGDMDLNQVLQGGLDAMHQ